MFTIESETILSRYEILLGSLALVVIGACIGILIVYFVAWLQWRMDQSRYRHNETEVSHD